jgi:hypothetical protein
MVIIGERLTDYQGLITGIPERLSRPGNHSGNDEERPPKPKARSNRDER